MTREDDFIGEVLERIPSPSRRAAIEMDLRAHLAERMEQGHSVDAAIRQFGDPSELAESYLESVPLVSASFLSRAAAKLVDFMAIVAVGAVVLWSAWQFLGGDGGAGFSLVGMTAEPAIITLCVLWFVVVCPGYFVVAEYYTGQTLGKAAMGLRVVRESGARISIGQSFVRQIPLVFSFFFLDVLFALFTKVNQRAFELISKTRVVQVDEDAA